MSLAQYIAAIVIVSLFLVGATFLSLCLRTRNERDLPLEKEVQTEEVQIEEEAQSEALLYDRPKRRFFLLPFKVDRTVY